MKKKEMLYAVIGGCVGAVLTLAVCSVSPLDGNFGKIICKELKVVGSDGKPRVTLSIGEYGGRVDVFGGGDYYYGGEEPVAKGMEALFGSLDIGDYGIRAVMGVDPYGNGGVSIWDKSGQRRANLE